MKPKLRESHPNLFRAFMIYMVSNIGDGLNFLILNPTFDPLNIPKEVAGITFMGLGLAMLVFLFLWHNEKMLRLAMATTIGVMCFWGAAQVVDFIKLGQTSLQLPWKWIILSILAMPLLAEPSINPVTDKNGGRN
jgi:ABC-type thiamin/hydroxymethylpyrimidine transport system permease subunit